MNIIKITFCIFLLLLLLPTYSVAEKNADSPKYLGYGMANTKCSKVSKHFNEEEFQFVLKNWLTGYMTAINCVLKENPVSLSSTDVNGAIKSIGAYCSLNSNKEDFLAQATEEYWRQRVKQLSVKKAQ